MYFKGKKHNVIVTLNFLLFKFYERVVFQRRKISIECIFFKISAAAYALECHVIFKKFSIKYRSTEKIRLVIFNGIHRNDKIQIVFEFMP